VARAGLAGGVSVVVDAVFNRRAERDAMRRLAREFGAGCLVVDCQAPAAVLHERLARRRAEGRDASDADASVLELQQRTREAPTVDEGATVILDTDCSISALRDRARAVGGSG
jgi:predicted kinase